ncbi:hypothetical protein [Natrialba sp. SSL1]|uniref:hypothetical protein n=1 Tax=Natrialba sp. SSL1 TaxID=1869245 RepID=UPI0008F9231D|nr:hypothetical protein [Natrialba sp. SSL1]OIB56664.1 hypothetical protein BBD46_16910 [Natrialba sp. SSL1]
MSHDSDPEPASATGSTGDPALELTPCPRCDTPVTRTTVIGPTDAIAGPCGCRVAPGITKRDRDHNHGPGRDREHEYEHRHEHDTSDSGDTST